MTPGVGSSDLRTGRAVWSAYTACAWAFVFAVPSFYWAVGGTVGMQTIARDPDAIPLIDDPFVVFATGVLKVLGGLLALALVQPWGRRFRRWPRRLAWAAGGFLTLYGAALLVQHGLMLTGAVATPDVLGATAARWHFWLWDPWWLVGGILFGLAAWCCRRES
ncbi:MAG: DUF3995 domain-containing protein [Chloroflexia bacterium]|nr:DUF3995 domain-containing protein [Chloroflexia bacterium]